MTGSLLRSIVDARVAVAEAKLANYTDRDELELYPSERAAICNAIQKRRLEFTAGRMLARQAMDVLGVARATIPVGPTRAPIWPSGLIGSITHTADWCAVAVAFRREFRSVGIDVETAAGLDPKLWPLVCVDAEITWLRSLSTSECGLASKLLFSAKESAYKAQHQITGMTCDFNDMQIALDVDRGRWSATFRVPLGNVIEAGDNLEGQLIFNNDLVATSVVISQ